MVPRPDELLPRDLRRTRCSRFGRQHLRQRTYFHFCCSRLNWLTFWLQDTLDFECKCRNGTTPVMANYEQSVPGQMCRFWYGACINATGQDASQQFACDQTRNSMCGNLTTKGEDPNESSSSSSSSRPTSTSSDSSSNSDASNTAESSGAAQTGANAPGSAARLARDFGAPVLAGGLIAFFGVAL